MWSSTPRNCTRSARVSTLGVLHLPLCAIIPMTKPCAKSILMVHRLAPPRATDRTPFRLQKTDMNPVVLTVSAPVGPVFVASMAPASGNVGEPGRAGDGATGLRRNVARDEPATCAPQGILDAPQGTERPAYAGSNVDAGGYDRRRRLRWAGSRRGTLRFRECAYDARSIENVSSALKDK
jgi:hypothetical protein